eukprot:1849529-Amphidinium_carterae.1
MNAWVLVGTQRLQDRVRRREEEMQSLEEALKILSGEEASFHCVVGTQRAPRSQLVVWGVAALQLLAFIRCVFFS